MKAQQFINPAVEYEHQALAASGGAHEAVGMPPYPLYGLGQGTTPAAPPLVPFYRQNWFWGVVGASGVALAWAYFGWWRHRGTGKSKRVSRNRGASGEWSKLASGGWEMRTGDESMIRVFGSGSEWDWIADYKPEGGRYRSKMGSTGSLDSAKKDAERWLSRTMSGATA